MLKLHRVSINSKFRFSLESITRGKYIIKAQGGSRSQYNVKQLILKLRLLDIKITSEKPHREIVNISSILKVELTLRYPREIYVNFSTWIRLSLSMEY